MLKREKWEQYGQELHGIMYGITVHNTGSDKSAAELFKWLEEENKTSQGCHYLVDENEVIQVMPLGWSVWHTGKAEDFGDLHTIAIEICRSQASDELYDQAEDKAVELMNYLFEKYGWDKTNVYFHQEFNERAYCPHKILDRYGTKAKWLKRRF